MQEFTEEKSFSSDDWSKMKIRLMSSFIIEAELSTLAENVGMKWRGPGGEMTPEELLCHSYEELLEHPYLKRPGKANQLMQILESTLEFDDPYNALLEEEVEEDENAEFYKKIEKLGIRLDYPVKFLCIPQQELDFCISEKLYTFDKLITFAANMSQKIVIGGELRTLINSIISVDKEELLQFLPLRRKENGMFLIDALKQQITKLPAPYKLSFYAKSGCKLNREQKERVKNHTPNILEVEENILSTARSLLNYFQEEGDELNLSHKPETLIEEKCEHIQDELTKSITKAILLKQLIGRYNTKQSFFSKIFGKT